MPPLAVNCALYAVFCVPAGKEKLVTVRVALAALIVMLSALVAVCALPSVTLTVKLLVPVAVGVPEIAPVDGASVRPAGNVPVAMLHV